MTKTLVKVDQNAFPNKTVPVTPLPDLSDFVRSESWPDTISAWAELYFRIEVTTSERSRQEQRRDSPRPFPFPPSWSGPSATSSGTTGRPARRGRSSIPSVRSSRRTAAAVGPTAPSIGMVAHLRTFATWIDTLRTFPSGHPTAELKSLAVSGVFELERAITADERHRLLDAADHLPVIGGRFRDRRRCREIEFPDERPRRKGYRPWRNRAIIYSLIETGIRRADVTSIDLQTLDPARHTLLITRKGGRQRKCRISKEGMRAISDYLREERGGDAEHHPDAAALFLPAATVVTSCGLEGADLGGANLEGAGLWHDNLELANLGGANLEGALGSRAPTSGTPTSGTPTSKMLTSGTPVTSPRTSSTRPTVTIGRSCPRASPDL